jgi:flagellar protein FliS
MTYTNPRAALAQYGQSSLQSEVAAASPHRLIQLLMEGALEKIAKSKGFLQRGEVAEKGRHIGWAVSIIDSLRTSLDHDQGGELAGNLEALYDYMERRLVQANAQNNEEILDEVADLLRDIKSAWDELPADVRTSGARNEGPVAYVSA